MQCVTPSALPIGQQATIEFPFHSRLQSICHTSSFCPFAFFLRRWGGHMDLSLTHALRIQSKSSSSSSFSFLSLSSSAASVDCHYSCTQTRSTWEWQNKRQDTMHTKHTLLCTSTYYGLYVETSQGACSFSVFTRRGKIKIGPLKGFDSNFDKTRASLCNTRSRSEKQTWNGDLIYQNSLTTNERIDLNLLQQKKVDHDLQPSVANGK